MGRRRKGKKSEERNEAHYPHERGLKEEKGRRETKVHSPSWSHLIVMCRPRNLKQWFEFQQYLRTTRVVRRALN